MEKTTRTREREASALFTYLKPKSASWPKRLHLAEVDGKMWWTDSYLLLPAGDAMTDLLARYNLTPEPMLCEVGRTIVRVDTNHPVNLAGLVVKYAPKRGMVDVAPLEFGGRPLVQIEATTGTQQVLWSTDGVKVTHRVDAKKVAVVEAAGGDRWRVAAKVPNAAMVRFDGKAPVGFLMPMRGVEGALGIDLEQTSRVAA